jgi:ATP-dependent DNA helicase RecG
MFRLLQGDVGSGKTIVAILAMLGVSSVENQQSAYMAPTDILAHQVYDIVSNYLTKYGIRVGLLVSSLKLQQKRLLKQQLKNGEIDILIGTHALIQEDVDFKDLSLVIIDEQHRFGVKQRSLLMSKHPKANTLLMSATPIPRTLAMVLFGHMDVSSLEIMPQGKRNVETKVVYQSDFKTLNNILTANLKPEQQAFVICPLIQQSELMDLQNVEDIYEMIALLRPNNKIAILHSQLDEATKQEVINKFRNKEIDILVSTTVIEVGLDIKNVELMIILDSERFGLAQLHQLRGRIGRSGGFGQLFLLTSSNGGTSQARLEFLAHNDDGFAISEFDLKLRGPGHLIGVEQSGTDHFQSASIHSDFANLKLALSDCQEIISSNDPLDCKLVELVKSNYMPS